MDTQFYSNVNFFINFSFSSHFDIFEERQRTAPDACAHFHIHQHRSNLVSKAIVRYVRKIYDRSFFFLRVQFAQYTAIHTTHVRTRLFLLRRWSSSTVLCIFLYTTRPFMRFTYTCTHVKSRTLC